MLYYGCTKDFEAYNTDIKSPFEVPSEHLFARAQKALADQHVSTDRALNNWKLFAQYWTQTTYLNEVNYDVITRNVGNNLFRSYYHDILANLREAGRLIREEQTYTDEESTGKSNRLHIIELVEVFAWQQLVDIFGDVPYSEALYIGNITPAYNEARFIYEDLISRAESATQGLDISGGGFGSADLYFGGDVGLWKKFGHSLLVKLGITLAEADPGLSQRIVESSWDQAFAYGEACMFRYTGGVNANPLHLELVQSGRHDFVPANTIVDIMNELSDPRRPHYFEMNGDTFRGGMYGASNPFFQYSHIGSRLEMETFEAVLLDYTETAFYLAEAAERGYQVGHPAAYWYESAIRSSMTYWGVDEYDTDRYLKSTDVDYQNPARSWREKIGTQAWLAMYGRGLEGWTLWRRLGYPAMNMPPAPDESADGQVPRRHTYPVSEQTLNRENHHMAADRIGGDRLSTPVFWDKHR